MLRLLFGAVVIGLLLIAGIAVGLYHLWGWKGLVAFPFLLVVILWLAKALVFKAIRRFLMGLISMKGAVLEGASVDVHSVKPVTKQEGWDDSDEDAADEPDDEAAETLSAQADESADESDEKEKPQADEAREKHYFEVDLTISPAQAKCFRLWTPSELELTSAPRKGLEDRSPDARLQNLLDAGYSPPAQPALRAQTTSNLAQPGSVTEHTTLHLKSDR